MRRAWRSRHPPRRQLVCLPRTYFEVEDVRPDENQVPAYPAAVFSSGEIVVPWEINKSILEFLTGKDLLRVAKVSKTVERVVRRCKALLFDAIRERIDDFGSRNEGQVNLHGFRKKNRVQVHVNGELVGGYCVRVTPKYVYYVRFEDIFKSPPNAERVKSEGGVVHVRPYIGGVVEVVYNWHVESRMSSAP